MLELCFWILQNFQVPQTLTWTSMAMDLFTLSVLNLLAKKWRVPRSMVMRQADRRTKADEDMKDNCPKPR